MYPRTVAVRPITSSLGKRLTSIPAMALLCLSFFAMQADSAPVGEKDARTAAVNWMALDNRPLGADLSEAVRDVRAYNGAKGFPLYYVVSLRPEGYVIVSADDLVEPIIAFSDAGEYKPVSENPLYDLVVNDLNGRAERARALQISPTYVLEGEELTSNEKWRSLLSGASGPSTQGLGSISDPRVVPLVQSRWRQTTDRSCGDATYNYYTPPGPNGDADNYPCGCVATAMAQLMRYWQHPTAEVGTNQHSIRICTNDPDPNPPPHTHVWNSQQEALLGGDGLGAAYVWGEMDLDPSCPDLATRRAIGRLCHDAGAAVNMDYCHTGSGTDTLFAANAFTSVFDYDNARSGYNSGNELPAASRNRMINANLHLGPNGAPVLLGITGPPPSGGHCVVVDGYGDNASTPYHHLNMGWADSQNVWYNLPNIDSTPSFNTVYKCVYNVFPSGSGEIIAGRVTDSGGNAISGATVTASPGGHSDTTDGRGIYGLRVASATSYTVSAMKMGYAFTTQNVSTGTSTNNTTTCGNQWPIDFVGSEMGTLVVLKYKDLDLDGVRDGDEPFISGWPVSYSGAASGSGTTKLETAVPPGVYVVTEDSRPGWRNTTAKSVEVEVSPGGTTVVEFGNICLGSITACKYRDLNMNSTMDGDESGIPGWPMRLTGVKVNGQTVGPIDALTGGDGCYKFADLDPGTYTVSEQGNGIAWEKAQSNCGATSYCDWRTTWAGKRWQATSPRPPDDCSSAGGAPSIGGIPVSCSDASVSFGNVCLTTISAEKFKDCDMDAIWDADEIPLGNWPMKLVGTRRDGRSICAAYGLTDASGKHVFRDIPPGSYSVSEESDLAAPSRIQWEKHQTTCGPVSYCDWRTWWNSDRWQATKPRPADNCSQAGNAPALSVSLGCDPQRAVFGNVPLGMVKAFKFHDMNLDKVYQPIGEADAGGDQIWTPAEPFTDLNCNGVWDAGEYFNDLNGNKTWDPAEQFADADGDGSYDWPECPVPTWPFALTGLRADGRPICPKGLTGADGWITFPDIPPSDSTGYRLAEDDAILNWCSVNLGWPDDPIKRCSYTVNDICTGAGPCRTIDRWQATTTTFRDFALSCGADREEQFGNICLARVDGVKEIYDDGMPGQADPVFRPWAICLAGKDHYGRDVIPSASACSLLPPAGQAPISIPCQSPAWYETICSGTDGTFSFVDLLPGHYHLTEQPDPNYRMAISRPMLSGFDVMCCPEEVEILNILKGLAWKVYQAYPGDSNGAELGDFGYQGAPGELIRAVPGVLKIVPGENWANYKQAAQLCRESPGKSTILIKKFDGFSQCGDVFYPLTVSQQGTSNVRQWWPLMYEPPTTSWTLRLIYGTKTAVRFPGESREGYVHEDVWKWVVETDIPHMKLFLDLLREVPFGLDEVPLISDEALYPALHAKLDAVQAAADAGNTASAGLLLGQFEMQVMDACIATSPAKPFPTGPGTGIANSFENPACCKLLVDAEYVGKTLNIFQPTKD